MKLKIPLMYAERGWKIFPVLPNGKRPMTRNGFLDATTEKDQVVEWWSKTADANIGVPVPKGNVVLDVDSEAALRALRWQDVELPSTVHAKTPRGHHFWYTAPKDLALKPQVDIFDDGGVDIRAPGSYVIVPPSQIRGRKYRWITKPRPENFTEAPNWLLEACRSDQSAGERPDHDPLDPEEILRGIPEGRRDWTLFRYACRLRQQHMRRREAEVLVLHAAGVAQPPFTEKEALKKVEQAWKYQEERVRETGAIDWIDLGTIIAQRPKDIDWFCFPMLRPGLTLVWSPAKFGKSTLISQLCRGVSMGKLALGQLQCRQAGVRYIDFEQLDMDDMVRHWYRLGFRQGDLEGADFKVATRIARADAGGLDAIRQTLDESPGVGLFIIDTLTLFWPEQTGRGNAYHWESTALGTIREIAMDYKVCLALIHHTNSRGQVSGSEAMRGIPHTLIKLDREGEGIGRIYIDGRGIKSYNFQVLLDDDGWRINDPRFLQQIGAAPPVQDWTM